VLKLQEVPTFLSWVICPRWWTCSSEGVSCVFPRLQQQCPVILDGAWALLCACASLFFCLW